MPILPVLLLMAQGTSLVQITVPLLHQRPSRLLRTTAGGQPLFEGVNVVANDQASVLIITGPKDRVEESRMRISLLDTQASKVKIGISIDSPINHANWQGDIETHSNLPWEGADGATGVKITVTPRLNSDGTCTISLKAKSEDVLAYSAVTRLKLNGELVAQMKAPGIWPASAIPKWMPKITIKYLGDGK